MVKVAATWAHKTDRYARITQIEKYYEVEEPVDAQSELPESQQIASTKNRPMRNNCPNSERQNPIDVRKHTYRDGEPRAMTVISPDRHEDQEVKFVCNPPPYRNDLPNPHKDPRVGESCVPPPHSKYRPKRSPTSRTAIRSTSIQQEPTP